MYLLQLLYHVALLKVDKTILTKNGIPDIGWAYMRIMDFLSPISSPSESIFNNDSAILT